MIDSTIVTDAELIRLQINPAWHLRLLRPRLAVAAIVHAAARAVAQQVFGGWCAKAILR